MSKTRRVKTKYAVAPHWLAIFLAFLWFLFSSGQTLAEQEAQPDKKSLPNKEEQKIQEGQESKLIEEKSPELKPDLPKLDLHKPEKPALIRRPLKGSIQHSEHIHANNQLNGNLGQGAMDSGRTKDTLKGNSRAGRVRGGLTQSTNSGLGIIGVKFIMGFGRPPIINRVFPGTPAAEAGMRPRDVIIAVDGIPTFGLSKDEVYNMIVGPPNTEVTISFQRNRDFQVRKLTRMDLYQIPDPQVRHDYLNM